jgi:hypothetical protein
MAPPGISALAIACPPALVMVGLGRLELPTSRLSGVRSNHLSYRPDASVCSLIKKKEKRRRRNPAYFKKSGLIPSKPDPFV